MKGMKFYAHFVEAYGTCWLVIFILAILTQKNIETGLYGFYGFGVARNPPAKSILPAKWVIRDNPPAKSVRECSTTEAARPHTTNQGCHNPGRSQKEAGRLYF
jgi:hypothetical protein